MREDNIEKYYNGIVNYTKFVESIIYGDTENNNLILNKDYINISTVGFISNIFLIIKEGIIDKKDSKLDSLILEETLEKNVHVIATKKDEGYQIDNYLFKDKETLVTELRNKIGHGDFVFDLENNSIIININNNEIKVNIKKLSLFVVSSLCSYLKNYKTNIFSRKMIINNKVFTNRSKPILNKSELIGFIKKFSQKTISIKSKDGITIPSNIIKEFENIVDIYEVCHDDKELYNNIVNFKKMRNNYDIVIENKQFKNIDYDTFITYFLNVMKPSVTFEEQVMILLKELERNENIENNKLNLLLDNFYNLIILEAIRDTNSVDLNIISKKVYQKYGGIYISSGILVTSLIVCFNALFSYGKDNIYVNNNKYTTLDNDGFDYSKLDLSKFNIELCNVSIGYVNEFKMKMNSKYKDLEKIELKINKINNCLLNVEELGVINKLNDKLIELNNKKTEISNEYNSLVEKYNEANDYYNSNLDYLRNERVIDGIRNSIAHGNYYIKYNVDINNSIIVFEDIFEGNLTLKCNIKIADFIAFLSISAIVINRFLNSNIKKLSKVLN